MELLGFGDKALELMGELCEKKAAVAAVVRDIRAVASPSGPPPPPQEQFRGGAVRAPNSPSGARSTEGSAPRARRKCCEAPTRRQLREALLRGAALGLPPQKNTRCLDEAQRETGSGRARKIHGDGHEEVEIPRRGAAATY